MVRKKITKCTALLMAAAMLWSTCAPAMAGVTVWESGKVIDAQTGYGLFYQYYDKGENGPAHILSADKVSVSAHERQRDAVIIRYQKQLVDLRLQGDGWNLTAYGDSGDGANLEGYNTLTAGNNLTVKTFGETYIEGSHGLRTNHSSKITVGNNLTVETNGARSYALYMAGSAKAETPAGLDWKVIDIGRDSRITTYGQGSSAAYISGGKSSLIVGDGAEWTTEGVGSNLLHSAASNVSISIGAGAVLKTKSNDARVLNVASGTNVSADIGADAVLQSEGSKAAAVYVSGSNSTKGENRVTFGERASLLTSGDASHGVHFDVSSYTYTASNGKVTSYDNTTGRVELGASSAIATAGDEAYGIYMAGTGGVADLGANSTVETTGDGSHALYGQEYIKVTPSGKAVYEYHYGKNGKINVGDGVTLSTSGRGSHGAYTSGDTTSIEFKGGATIAVHSADSYALYANAGKITSAQDTNGDVVSGGKFTISGDMKTGEKGVIDLMMTDGSYIFGKTDAGSGDLSLRMAGTSWDMTGSSTVTNLNVAESTINFGGESLDRTLTVKNLRAEGERGATFLMQSNVETGETDKLIVTGDTTGDHFVTVRNDGAQQTTGKETLTIVETQGGGNFDLTDNAELGAWLYGLRQVKGAENDWELYATGKSGPTAGAAVGTFMGGYLMSYAETQTLMQRLGDLRDTPYLSGFWFRAYGGKMESNSRSFVRGFDMDFGGVQIGYDRKVENSWKGDTYLGGFFGYGKGDLDYRVTENGRGGSGTVDSKTLGVYATYVQDDGFYADAVLKYMWMNNKFDVLDTAGDHVTGDDAKTGGLGLSLELGKRFRFQADDKGGNWYVEPQLQYSYTHQDGASFYASNGLRIGVDSFTSSLGRLGVLVGYETVKTNFYAKVSLVKEFDGDVNVIANGQSVPESFSDSWWVYGVGFTSKLNERNNIYMSLERSEGGKFTEPWRIYGGWRINL